MARQMQYRVIYNEGGVDQARLQVVNLRISQDLVGAAPAVANIDVSGPDTCDLARGAQIDVYQLDAANVQDDGTYKMWHLFRGDIDSTSASSYPKSVSILATDFMYRLQRVRVAEARYTTSADDDGEMVKAILDYCNVPYTASNIESAGYSLDLITPLVWRSGQSGQELLQEIDEITGMATVMFRGEAYRFPWAPYGKPFSEISGDISKVQRFYRGQKGIMFYNDERELGSQKGISTFVRVEGYAWQNGDCNNQIIAQGSLPVSVLGDGVYTMGDPISSELIQGPEMAAKIARRHLEWYARSPDAIKIFCGNDRRITVGDVVAVYDPTWGINLNNDADPLCYRVMSTERDGDLLTLDCLGGPKADTSAATIDGWRDQCCGTQAEDGTCTPNDPSGPPGGPGGDGTDTPPDVPGFPDPPIIDCDPITDTSCLPDNDPDIPEPPDQTKPWTGCSEEEYQAGSGISAGTVLGSGAPADVCVNRTYQGKTDNIGNLLLDGYTATCNVLLPWREVGTDVNSMRYDVKADGTLEAVHGRGTLRYNSEVDPALQSEATDYVLPPGATFAFDAVLNWGAPTATFTIALNTVETSIKDAWVQFFSGDGIEQDDCFYGWWARLPVGNASVNYCDTPTNSSPGGLARNSGQYGGSPAPTLTDMAVGAYFDMSTEYNRIDVYGDLGSGYSESERNVASIELHYAADDVHRYIEMRFTGPEPLTAGAPYTVLMKSLILGVSDCSRNPHYLQPGTDI